jgi:hypothetical protein
MSRQLSTRQTTIVTKLRKRFRRHEPLTQPASAIPRAVHKHFLGEIDADEYDSHGFPLPSELMRVRTSHRDTYWPVAALRLTRDGEVPFIR